MDKLRKAGVVIGEFFLVLLLVGNQPTMAADTKYLKTVYDTLSNPRISYKAGVGASVSSGSTTVTIDSSGNPDNDTHNLFPQDTVCFSPSDESGCIGSATYTVGTVVNATTFAITSPLSDALSDTDLVVASQSAVHTVVFDTVADVSNGYIKIKIPAADTNYNDGIPDTTGFDAADLTNDNIGSYSSIDCSGGGCGVTFGTTTFSTSEGYHIISFPFTGTFSSGKTVTVTLGSSSDTSYEFVNPAPTGSHTQGVSDIYSIQVLETDNSGNTVYSGTTKVAVHEGVFVSATVEETLHFYINGEANDGTADSGTICGVSRGTGSIDTTAYSIPFGSITASDTFYDAYQTLKVVTNAADGYVVTVEENDQMGRNGNTCTGSAPSSGEYTFGSGTCIRDTTCDDGSCTESTSADWATATNHGFGYSLENVTGTDAAFTYNESSRTFSARQIADQESSETKQTVMSKSSPTTASKVNICFRLSVPGDQPAGYYYNVIKYTATPKF